MNIDFSGLLDMLKPTQKATAIRFLEQNNKIVYGEMVGDFGHITNPIELVDIIIFITVRNIIIVSVSNIDDKFKGYDFCQSLYDTLYKGFPNEIEELLDDSNLGEYNFQLILTQTGYMIFFPEGSKYQNWFLEQKYPKLDEKGKGTK